MTLAEMVADVKSRIGSEPEVSDAVLQSWLNQALLVFTNEYDFTWLEKEATFSVITDQERYSLPTDCKRPIELTIDSTSTTPNVYSYVPYQERHNISPSQKAISRVGNVLIIYPSPEETGSNNGYLTYVRRGTKMTEDADSPSDFDIANMPEVYHEALVLYAFATYQTYDEEHDEKNNLMGNPRGSSPGSFYYFVEMAKREDIRQKRGGKRRFLSRQEAVGYSKPNRAGRNVSPVLGV